MFTVIGILVGVLTAPMIVSGSGNAWWGWVLMAVSSMLCGAAGALIDHNLERYPR